MDAFTNDGASEPRELQQRRIVLIVHGARSTTRCPSLMCPEATDPSCQPQICAMCRPSVPGMGILQHVAVRCRLAFPPRRTLQTVWRQCKNNCRRHRLVAGGVGLLLPEESDDSTDICFLWRNESLGSRMGKGPSSVVVLPLSSWFERFLMPFMAGQAAEV